MNRKLGGALNIGSIAVSMAGVIYSAVSISTSLQKGSLFLTEDNCYKIVNRFSYLKKQLTEAKKLSYSLHNTKIEIASRL